MSNLRNIMPWICQSALQNRAVTRRNVLRSVLPIIAAPLLIDLLRARNARGGTEQVPLNRFPRMVQEHFVAAVRRIERQNAARRARVSTREDAAAYVEDARRRIRECFGPFPERTPLNSLTTGVVERDAYRIEKVIFESRPGFPVTANLYIPAGDGQPRPGVVGTCGHAANGKAAADYQAFAQGLARLGYVVLIYDPIGQGERLQYVGEDLSSRLRPGVREHLQAGNQQFLVGEFFGTWRAWDGVRALDYLLARDEVDAQHVGVTGNSGGGTMTTWLCGLDQRWSMAAPSCFVTSFRRNLENELPADTEQCPPKALALGLDHHDFLAALAPRPTIILAQELDFFDARGAERAHRELRKIYAAFGAGDRTHLFMGPTYHGYTRSMREAMYRWFHQATGQGTMEQEPDIIVENDEVLWCTPHGQVAERGARTVFDFTREKSQQLASTRGKPRGAELQAAVGRVLRLPDADPHVPEYRILRNLGRRGYPRLHTAVYAVETEPGIHAVVYRLSRQRWLSRPPRGRDRALLYVAHLSSDDELRSQPMLAELIDLAADDDVYTCDVRGIGESLPDTCGANSFHHPYGCDYFYAIHSLMLDRPYLGRKTYDVLRVLQWMASFGMSHVHLAANGYGALAGAFASLLSPVVDRVTLNGALDSYASIAETQDYDWPLSALLPGVLTSFDLPDIYEELTRTKQLRMIEPRGAT